MVIFHSYVSLPEGNSNRKIHELSKFSDDVHIKKLLETGECPLISMATLDLPEVNRSLLRSPCTWTSLHRSWFKPAAAVGMG